MILIVSFCSIILEQRLSNERDFKNHLESFWNLQMAGFPTDWIQGLR